MVPPINRQARINHGKWGGGGAREAGRPGGGGSGRRADRAAGGAGGGPTGRRGERAAGGAGGGLAAAYVFAPDLGVAGLELLHGGHAAFVVEEDDLDAAVG